jgi:hypothetical protein
MMPSRRFARIAAALALRRHAGLKAGLVDGDVVTAQDVLGHVDGEAVRVVQLEGDLTGKHRLPRTL